MHLCHFRTGIRESCAGTCPLPVWGDACYIHVKNWRYQTTVLQVLASYHSDDIRAENSVGFTLCSRLLA